MIGGTEVSYNAKDNKWTAHFHLLIFGASDAALKNFAQKCKTDAIPRAVDEPKELKNPVEQITYLQKFSTYYRIGGFDERGKGRAIPMKRDQLAALAKWTGTHPLRALSVPGWISAKCRWNPSHKKASSVATKHTPAPAMNKIGGRNLAAQRI